MRAYLGSFLERDVFFGWGEVWYTDGNDVGDEIALPKSDAVDQCRTPIASVLEMLETGYRLYLPVVTDKDNL
jgi:hypothetical protein